MVGNVLERLEQLLVSERLSDDERMQSKSHDPAAVSRVGVQLVQLVSHELDEVRPAHSPADEHVEIVQLDGVGHAQHAGHVRPVGLVVVGPVQYLAQTELG